MKHITYTCDMCGKTVISAYWCNMSFALYDKHGYTTTPSMDVCGTCLKQLKKIFSGKETASVISFTEAEAE